MLLLFFPKIMVTWICWGGDVFVYLIISLSHILTLLSLFDFLKIHPLEIPTEKCMAWMLSLFKQCLYFA